MDERQPIIYPVGTRMVTKVDVIGPNGRIAHPRGSVGVVVRTPSDLDNSYRVRFPDGYEEPLSRDQVELLAEFKEDGIGNIPLPDQFEDRIIYRCIIGSRAYGLDDDASDTDRRGIFLPTAEQHWSLFGIPEQIENHDAQECYWELQKFLILALKANPNILECLYSPMVEFATPLARELLAMRSMFLSRLVYQTYNGYVLSQFKKMQADLRNHGTVKWKHVMHLIRLLISGIHVLREADVQVQVGEHREQLRAIKRGEMSWEETERWRLSLHTDFEQAYAETILPERPDYAAANAFLLKARREAVAVGANGAT